MPFSAFTTNKVMDHLLGSGTWTKPAALYAAAFVGDPEGAGVEVSGGSYARVSVAAFTITANAGENGAVIEWPIATGSWGTIDYVALYDASSGGNRLLSAVASVPKSIVASDILRIPVGDFDVSVT